MIIKDIFVSVCSGLIGVLLTISYQHFLAPAQSFIFINDGDKVRVTKAEYIEILEDKSKLENEFYELQVKYNELETTKSMIEYQYNNALNQNNNLIVKVNELNEQNEQLLSQINENNGIQNNYIDNNEPQSPVNLFSLPTFKENFWVHDIQLAVDVGKDNDDYIQDAWGNLYRDAYICMFDNMDEYGWANWVFDQPYTKLQGELVANLLTKFDKRAWLEFFDQDGNLLYITDYVSAAEVEHSYKIEFEVDLTNVTQLTIKFRSNSRSDYGLMPKMILIP